MMPHESEERITIRLSHDLRSACEEQAKKENRSLSNWAKRALKMALPDSTKRPRHRRNNAMVG